MPPGTGTHSAFRFESEQKAIKRRQSDCLVILSFSLPSIACPNQSGDSGWPNRQQHWRSDCECAVDCKDTAKGGTKTINAKVDGSFSLRNLAPGVFEVTVTAKGFVAVRTTVTVIAGTNS